MENNIENSNKLVNYTFDKKWIAETEDILDLYSKTDENFPHVSVVVADNIGNSKVFLGFRNYYEEENDSIPLAKKAFIQETSGEEREYLKSVFYKNVNDIRFSANDGRYELYYPYFKDGKKIVLYFSDYQRYGKIGS